MSAESSTPRSHPAIHKLDVARARLRDQIVHELDAEQFDSAIGLIREIQGLGLAVDVLLTPDASFDEP